MHSVCVLVVCLYQAVVTIETKSGGLVRGRDGRGWCTRGRDRKYAASSGRGWRARDVVLASVDWTGFNTRLLSGFIYL